MGSGAARCVVTGESATSWPDGAVDEIKVLATTPAVSATAAMLATAPASRNGRREGLRESLPIWSCQRAATSGGTGPAAPFLPRIEAKNCSSAGLISGNNSGV